MLAARMTTVWGHLGSVSRWDVVRTLHRAQPQTYAQKGALRRRVAIGRRHAVRSYCHFQLIAVNVLDSSSHLQSSSFLNYNEDYRIAVS